MEISGKTRICGVIGDPIEHTLSPVMHNAAFKHLGLDFAYLAFRVKKTELKNAIKGMRSLGIHGLNVTMPHKVEVIKYLDDVDSAVNFIGAANTILNDAGKLLGFNTDGIGAIRALEENAVKIDGKRMLLLGAGGAAKAIAFSAAEYLDELVILNRNFGKAKRIAEILRRNFNKKIIADALSQNNIKEHLKNSDILINATPVGMHPNENQSLVAMEWLRPDIYVMDIIYDPVETKLLKDAKKVGAKVISGIEMLIHQGAASFEIWTGRQAPIKIMKEAVLRKLREENSNC
jgi:shikimate dehydrogenase